MHDGDTALNIMLAAAAVIKPAVGIHNLRSELATSNFLLCTMINKAVRLDM